MNARALGVATALALWSTSSLADTAPSIDVRTWAPSVDPGASVVLEPPGSPGPWAFAAGAWSYYDRDSVVLRSPATGGIVSRPLANEVGLDLVASLGLGARGEVGARIPTLLYEQGSAGLSSSTVSSGAVPTAALGDLALAGKETLVANDQGGFGLAALGLATFPTGSRTSFASERGATVALRLLADVSTRVISVQGSVGYVLRTSHVAWPALGPTFGDSIPWTIGVLFRPHVVPLLDPGNRQTWEAALHGSLPAGPASPFAAEGSALRPALLSISDRIGVGHYQDAFFILGVDVGLDRAVGVPAARALAGIGFRFGNHDEDGDGIRDDVDQCPRLAEDRDGFEDSDGCPEVDNDDDGIIDALDACRDVPGVPSPDPRKNGCPEERAMPSVTPVPPPASAARP